MTAPIATTSTPAVSAVADAVSDLVAELERQPPGQVSPSVYETGRLVADAPWLTGHGRRLAYLLGQQGVDGAWGAAGGYALVPTASAVEALLAELVRADPAGPGAPTRADLVRAGTRGLLALAGRLAAGGAMPDTPAADLIVPALAARIDAHLTRLHHGDDASASEMPRALPPVDRRRLNTVDALLDTDRPVPDKLWHAYEVLGPAAAGRTEVSPVAGAVGASPAATAAWLGHRRSADRSARAYLDEVVSRHGGPVPCCTPITVFERSWTLATLSRVGLPARPSPELIAELVAALGPRGAATGPGLPADADTTSATLYALARLGRPVDPVSLDHYDLGSHFCTWRGEDGHSVTTNAHVLEALGWHSRHTGDGATRYAPRVAALAGWLCERQQRDGHWADRWHASPYYATCCVVLALARYAPPGTATACIDRAVDWVLATQRADGGWGRWSSTAEETAYAVHILLGPGHRDRPEVPSSVRRALAHLPVETTDHPPLWHDKDLYAPLLIVRAAVLAARHLALGVVAPSAYAVGVSDSRGHDHDRLS
ncbi:prenyltransferase/squalene oxidase repeat-containing protein [Micromonospora sp. CP22]|uniref:prenyltransferase/squalene oxidase repeat-containing protein n=1 Tax=Micromonospora sp. CP22 TaxID=2580517 RepID=UPI00281526FF|nr:prenyltransferase/squalene oxidase repeat-containing protein [Micromonospora sp. CP22]